jgi:hypothetical protein
MRFRDTLIDDLNAISPAKRALAFTLATLGGLAAWQVPTLWPSYILPGVSPACVLIAAAAAMCSWRSWPWTCWSLPVSSLSDRSVRSGTLRAAISRPGRHLDRELGPQRGIRLGAGSTPLGQRVRPETETAKCSIQTGCKSTDAYKPEGAWHGSPIEAGLLGKRYQTNSRRPSCFARLTTSCVRNAASGSTRIGGLVCRAYSKLSDGLRRSLRRSWEYRKLLLCIN